MLVAIESCEAHLDRLTAQFMTWAKSTEIVGFTGHDLGVPDDYGHLPEKTRAICKYAEGFDYLFKCDTDTYASISRLLASGFEQYDYSGYVLDSGYCSGGAGYWLSQKAMRIVAEQPIVWEYEDMQVGLTLKRFGILPHHDERYALYRDVLPDNDVISRHLSSRAKYEIKFIFEAHRKMEVK